MRSLSLLIAIVGLVALTFLARAMAQNNTPPGAEALSVSGTIDALTPDQGVRIKVADSDEMWLVAIKPEQTKIEITGTAEPAFLRSGLTVRFDGEIDKKGNLQAEIKELEIFTPQGKNALGLFSDKSAAARPVGKPAPGPYEIRAKVTSLKDHEITLAAGSKKVFGSVADDVAVKVSSEDFGYVHEGDGVKVTGWYNPANKAASGKPGQAVADELTITLAKPLVATKKPSRASAKASKSAKAAKEPKDDSSLIQDPFGVEQKPSQ